MVFAAGWACGMNPWATGFIIGILGRLTGTPGVPRALEHTGVLVTLGILMVLELIVDKIRYVDSLWDTFATLIRPTAGVLLSILIATTAHAGSTARMAVIGGLAALAAHLTKAAIRLAINTYPEPIGNLAVSGTDDILMACVAALAALHPAAAAVFAGTLLVIALTVVVLLFPRVRKGMRSMGRFFAGAGHR